MYWYADSAKVADHLYESPSGNTLLVAEGADLPLAAARLLGRDIASTIGTERLAELIIRWPGDQDLLVRELTVRAAEPSWPGSSERRYELLAALTRGLAPGGQP